MKMDLQDTLRRFTAEAITGELATPRYRMRYSTWGEGPPLVFIHGLNDVPRSFVPLMAQLSKDFRCIAMKLPEGREDGAVLRRYRHEDYTRDLIALLDHLKLDEVFLLGSSFGTTISLRTTAEHPKRVKKLMLQGGFAHRPLKPEELGLTYLGQSWPWRMGALPLRPLVMKMLERRAFAAAPAMKPFLLENSSESKIKAVIHRARMLQTLDLRPMLPSIRQPVLLFGGDCDAIVPRDCEAELERGLPDVRRIEYSPCGHYPQYTHFQDMAAAVREFLN